ncbi:MAG: hypothetical protein AAF183_12890 [Pseudomonadota bacterium]
MSRICDRCGLADASTTYTIGFGAVQSDGEPAAHAVIDSFDLCPACARRVQAAVEQIANEASTGRRRRRAVLASDGVELVVGANR